jgi:hypothetical protein
VNIVSEDHVTAAAQGDQGETFALCQRYRLPYVLVAIRVHEYVRACRKCERVKRLELRVLLNAH